MPCAQMLYKPKLQRVYIASADDPRDWTLFVALNPGTSPAMCTAAERNNSLSH